MCVRQASIGVPLMLTAQDPQIADRHEQRIPIEPSWKSRACRIPSRTVWCGASSTVKGCQEAGSPLSGR